MKRFFKMLGILFVLIGIGILGYFLYTQTDLFRISKIEFNDHDHLNLTEIQRESGIYLGLPYFMVDVKDAKMKLETHPFVKSAAIKKSFPGLIAIEIVYRTHAFNLTYSDITLSLDSELYVLEVLEAPKSGFTVEGFEFNSFSTGELIRVDKRYLLENVVQLIELFQKSHVTVVPSLKYEKNGIIADLNEIKVKFGDGENIQKRFNAFVSIYDDLSLKGITSGIIDVSTDGLPIYKPFGE
jgi:cell division protein FtsQ